MDNLDTQIASIKDQLAHPENLGTKTSVYTRVTGYYRNIADMNDGKRNECRDRKSFKTA